MRLRTLAVVLTWLAALGLLAASHRHHGLSTRTNGPIHSCSDIDFDSDRAVARGEQSFALALGTTPVLDLDAEPNGGVQVWGTPGNAYRVTACKAAVADSHSEAQALLGRVSVTASSDGVVRTTGPGDDAEWSVFYIVEAPENAHLKFGTLNGPLAFENVNGTINAHATNGPIALKNCRGTIEVTTTNGPIDLAGGGGAIRMHADNGPVAVHLSGTTWGSGGVEASAINGPLELELPANYQSAVRVEASANSPIQCRAPQCHKATMDWDEPRRIDLGSGTPVIRMSTVNGPVSIDSDTGDEH